MPSESTNASPIGGTLQRACDNCKNRKVRCDKALPCSNCKASGTECRTTVEQREPRQRILISAHYEKKIDSLEEKLNRIEGLLQSLVDSSSTRKSNKSQAGTGYLTPTQSSSNLTPNAQPSPEKPVEYGGQLSVNANSIIAQNFLKDAVASSPYTSQNPEMTAALYNLQQIVERQRQPQIRPFLGKIANVGISREELPPIDLVLEILRRLQRTLSFAFLCCFPHMSIPVFVEKCKAVYFDPFMVDVATSVIVHGGLAYLCKEQAWMTNDPIEKETFEKCITQFRANFQKSLNEMPLNMPATGEYIDALLIASSDSMENGRVNQTWTYNSAAVRLCMMLGYHRASTMTDDSIEVRATKHIAFWSAYITDKSLSLRLGRPPAIQDFDVDITPPVRFGIPEKDIWIDKIGFWVKMSNIEGRVYEELYSPRALKQSTDRRIGTAVQLAQDLEQVGLEATTIEKSSSEGPDFIKLLLSSTVVSRHIVRTLIFYAIPGDSRGFVNKECLESARSTLASHNAISEKHKHEDVWSTYLNFAIINAPLTPFIVVFCHSIAFSDEHDLALLHGFVNSFGSAVQKTEVCAKLHKLCSVLHHVAKTYVEAKKAGSGALVQQQMSGGVGAEQTNNQWGIDQFDRYLNALELTPGFIGNATWPNGPVTGPDQRMSMTSNPENQVIMNLLEDDLSYLDMDTYFG
ncbi:hypothetical protein P152DRAFT_455055 [Eremomyces bilateralis CBS 781.70]|uniref:Zn(2)-C6 fungal-type domain-containing protein n=1 Tax=Eremomyces bilateralis CBS 781.70 TaxID=1392243 RepID=A0A6G1GB71_9PEZI|nr:uncharacterized protein P152DRAFT_455055 [Eremomyces bilateralis CBS 781.70]KAF1815338.1 hypothetical protein P152DRAFT_455055 [Eremomyces bilateralis CBS 781.70]